MVVSLGAFLVYQARFSDRVASLREAVSREGEVLARARAQREQLDVLVTQASSSREGVGTLYLQTFASESERFVAFIREVRALADRSGLEHPPGYTYPEELPEEDWGLIKRSVVFSVVGTYQQLRTFVNLLELSDEFIVLEGVQLADAEARLSIGLTLSTFFAGRDAGPSV
jgi:hypothetical protein